MAENDASATPEQEEKGPWGQHEQLANYLRAGILTGDYPPDSNLPSTRVLKEQFGVAPQTIKNANDMLAQEGLVRSQRGKGIVVRPHRQQTVSPAATKPPAEPGEAYRWISEAEKTGRRGSSTLLDVAEIVPPADVVAAMGLGENETAIVRTQILSLDDEPAEFVKTYYPKAIAEGTQLAEKRKIKGGAPRLLADMGYPTVRYVDRVEAWLPTPEQARALAMPGKLPILRTLRKVFSAEDQIIEVTVMAKAGHLYALEYEL